MGAQRCYCCPMRLGLLALCVVSTVPASGCADSEDARLRIYVDDVEWTYDGPNDGNLEFFFHDGSSLAMRLSAVRDINLIDGSRSVFSWVGLRDVSPRMHLPIYGSTSMRGWFTPEPDNAPEVDSVSLLYECAFCPGSPEDSGEARDERLSGYIDLDVVNDDLITGYIDLTADPLSQYPGVEPHSGRMVGPFHAPHHAPYDR